jgi:predicted DCC family thiol-disulfide oxidoreductase YuxK
MDTIKKTKYIQKIIVLYDADCGFCLRCRQFIEERNPLKNIIFYDIHALPSELTTVFDLKINPQKPESIVVIEGDTLTDKFKACIVIGKNLSDKYSVLSSILQYIPTRIGNWGYDVISRNRKIICKIIDCQIKTAL